MSRSLLEYRLERKFHRRLYIFASIIFTVALVFVVQLANLQIVQGAGNRELAKRFVSRQEFTVAPRGLMLDRNARPDDEPLVANIRFIDFVIYPSRFTDRDEALAYVRRFASVMGRSFNDYAEHFEPAVYSLLDRRNKSITLIHRMTRRQQERLAAFKLADEHGEFVPNHLRYYSMGPALAHVTGYTGRPSARELELGLAESYQTLGKNGLEKEYDSDLRGKDGVTLRHIVIDSQEQVASTVQGHNLILTIDRDVQAAAYRALERSGRRGTAVAMNAGTGEVLALASFPSFDPNILSSGTADQRRVHLSQISIHQAFLNRALQTRAPPASTIKPLVALAALEAAPDRDVFESTTYACYGRYVLASTRPGVPDSIYRCWTAGHGRNDIVGAIAESCNVYFYNLGYHIGPTPMIYYAKQFGLDARSGIDLPNEEIGTVPDQTWKRTEHGVKWYDGDTLNFSIGQGFLQITPISQAVAYSALVNRGKILRPYLVREIRNPEGNEVQRLNPNRAPREVPISLAGLYTVQKGMRAVVTRGTATNLNYISRVPIAGKSGTAQTRSSRTASDHAWFAAFGPYGADPEETVVVVVFIEHGQGGSAVAGPVAAEIINAAFPDWTPADTARMQVRILEREREINRFEEMRRARLNPEPEAEDQSAAEAGLPNRIAPTRNNNTTQE